MSRLILSCLLFLFTGLAWAQPAAIEPLEESHEVHTSRPDSHAPIGVMGDHLHKKGEWMVSYRFKNMGMDGSLNGSSDISDQTILKAYRITPTRMTMSAHMLGLMVAPSDNVTLMFGLPFMHKNMDHITRAGGKFTTTADGVGDFKATALVNLWKNDNHELHFNAGLSLPTGTVEARDSTPMGPDQILPYPMQLGSGTIDLNPGLTYTGESENWSWGGQLLGTIRVGSNKRGYTLGNEGEFSIWGARRFNEHASSSLRLNGKTWGNISGSDPALNPLLIPTADPNLRAGSRLDALLGLNSLLGDGNRLSIEAGVPIAQSLDGPQLKTKYVVTAGWQYSF